MTHDGSRGGTDGYVYSYAILNKAWSQHTKKEPMDERTKPIIEEHLRQCSKCRPKGQSEPEGGCEEYFGLLLESIWQLQEFDRNWNKGHDKDHRRFQQ